MHMPRVALVNLGCRVNRAELDAIGRELGRLGLEVTGGGSADAVIVNTCAVTSEAEAKARKAVRHAAAMPGVCLVVATGCSASLFAGELEEIGPYVLVEPDKGRVAALVARRLGSPDAPRATMHEDACRDSVTPSGRMRPGLKVQDGCDRRCTYCIVWKARGPARSLPASEVVSSVRSLVSGGAREVVLTGIDLGRYESGGVTLPGLLSCILEQTDVGRVRLSSVEPAGVTDELLEVIASSGGRVAPFLHVPLQSGCDATLRRMGRPYSAAKFERCVSRARQAVPGISLSTDVIVGFPGETDKEFEESLAACERLCFSSLHVFRYSRRPGTPAASMDAQVDAAVSARRSRRMRELSRSCAREFSAGLVGTRQLVLCEHGCMGTTGAGVRVRTDPGLVGKLTWLVPHAYDAAGVLDARS